MDDTKMDDKTKTILHDSTDTTIAFAGTAKKQKHDSPRPASKVVSAVSSFAPAPASTSSSLASASASASASAIMESLLKSSGMDWNEFLETIWETKCHRFAFHKEKLSSECYNINTNTCSNVWSETVRRGWNVLRQLMDDEYSYDLVRAVDMSTMSASANEGVAPPLLFRDLRPMDDPEEIQRLYNNSLYAAYLAGTSIVWNHVDLKSPRVAALCEDLQGGRVGVEQASDGSCFFPHAYANAYLTPPNSQTVPPHADDRDVLVFQLVGHKYWKVYRETPIRHPYPHEQAGKSGIAVPDSVLEGPLAFDGCLREGDVLYIPRGMVHEATTSNTTRDDKDNDDDGNVAAAPDLSFHITVALATHDWTLGGNLSQVIQRKLMNSVGALVLPSATSIASTSTSTSTSPTISNKKTSLGSINLRRSLLPTARATSTLIMDNNAPAADTPSTSFSSCGGFLLDTAAIQNKIDAVFERLQTEITAESIAKDLNHRIETHNLRASEKRKTLITTMLRTEKEERTTGPRSEPETKSSSNTSTSTIQQQHPMDSTVGPVAAKNVSLETRIRASTPVEREYAQKMLLSRAASSGSSPPAAGLNVRDEIGDDVAEIITKIKAAAATITTQQTTAVAFRVGDFQKLIPKKENTHSLVCNLTSLSLAKRVVELGAFAIVVEGDDEDDAETSETATKRKRI